MNRDLPFPLNEPKLFGTPKTLQEVVRHIMMLPMNELEIAAPLVIRDFLAQRFGAAYLEAKPEEVETLKKLFEEITREEK